MHLIGVLLSLIVGVTAFWGHRVDPHSSQFLQLRDLSSCEQAYGEGWAQCNGAEFMGCYNPGLGQTCCDIDGGHCQAGSYCAPVAGHCCIKGQTLGECAKGGGFDVFEQQGLVDHKMSHSPTTVTKTKTRTITVDPPGDLSTILSAEPDDVVLPEPMQPLTSKAPSDGGSPSQSTTKSDTFAAYPFSDLGASLVPSSTSISVTVPSCPPPKLVVASETDSSLESLHMLTETTDTVTEVASGVIQGETRSTTTSKTDEETRIPAVDTDINDAPSHQTSLEALVPTQAAMAVPGYPSVNRTDMVPTILPYVSQAVRHGTGSCLALAVIMAILASW